MRSDVINIITAHVSSVWCVSATGMEFEDEINQMDNLASTADIVHQLQQLSVQNEVILRRLQDIEANHSHLRTFVTNPELFHPTPPQPQAHGVSPVSDSQSTQPQGASASQGANSDSIINHGATGKHQPFAQGKLAAVQPVPLNGSPAPAAEGAACRDVQEDYLALDRSLKSKVSRLPPECLLLDSKAGIKGPSFTAYTVLSKSGRFCESLFRKLASIDSDNVTEEDLNDLFTIGMAQMGYLRDEYAGIVVDSKFDEDTSKWFRSMNRNTGGLSAKHQDILKTAAELSAHAKKGRDNNNKSFRGNTRGRGGSFRGGRGGGGDRFQQWSNKSFGDKSKAKEED